MHTRVSLLLPALAFTAVASLAGSALASAPQDTVYLHGIPYGADGAYFHSGNFYNDMPVYTLDHAGTTWSLYQRSNGRWYVDFNDVSEDWSGTVAIGPLADLPFDDSWNSASQAASSVGAVVIGGAAYTSSTTGTYAWDGTVYNGKPVFTHLGGGTTWSIYQRSNGRWYLDFNDVSEDWDGTVEIGPLADTPFDDSWDDANMAIASTAELEIFGAAYDSQTRGSYTFDGQTIYNGAPVFQHVYGNTTWSIYRRTNGRWYLDFNDVSEDWDGTVAIGPDAISPTQDEWQTSGMVVLDATNRPIPLRGRHDFGTFTTGTDCRDITFAAPFDGDDVNVQLSIDHANGPGTHDATTVWAEGVDRDGARICVRETSNFDGSHDANLSVSYVAYRPGALLDGEAGRFEDSDGFTGTGNHCNTIEFDQTFALAPIVQVTVTHPDTFSGNNGAITAWLEQVTTTEFVVCVRETAEQAADHPAYAIDWIAHESSSWPFYGADEAAAVSVPAFSGSKCMDVAFATAYADVPQLLLTADHRDAGGNHDATTVWLEDLRSDGFRACVRELANAGNPGSNATGSHDANLKLAWTAVGNR